MSSSMVSGSISDSTLPSTRPGKPFTNTIIADAPGNTLTAERTKQKTSGDKTDDNDDS